MSKQPVYVISDNITSSLGFTTADNIEAIRQGRTGIRMVEAGQFSANNLPFALVCDQELDERTEMMSISDHYSKLERMMLFSVKQALQGSTIDTSSDRCVFVVSTTKGNIDQLFTNDRQPMLWQLGERIRHNFNNPNRAIVVSHACISGVLAIEVAVQMLRSGLYDHAVVTGGDLVSRFVVSGFESLHALSNQPCKPYDVQRDGLTLGEGCATMVLSRYPAPDNHQQTVSILYGATSNDATHISAPDRTGTGLGMAIDHALKYSGIAATDISSICAHGTATIYNDEMEAHAFMRTGLQAIPVYSLKGYWGHTLGAAGLMESVAAVHSLKEQILFGTLGYESCGTSIPLQITKTMQNSEQRYVLKTASGFGGCNAALVLKIG